MTILYNIPKCNIQKGEDMGNSISKLRKEKKMTQSELAELIGVTQETISKLENGKRKLDINIAQKIAIAFEVSLDELFHGI